MAQQKQHFSYNTPASQTTYTQQHIIDVGDIPGHQARLFEIRRTYGNDAPIINGLKLKEQWTRGMSDYIDNNGPAIIYNVWVLENGEKFFVRTSLVAQSSGDGKLIPALVMPDSRPLPESLFVRFCATPDSWDRRCDHGPTDRDYAA